MYDTDEPYGNISSFLSMAYDMYVDNLMRGCTAQEAALRAGARSEHLDDWIRMAEMDSYVIAKKDQALKAQDIHELWNAPKAALKLLQIVDDQYEAGRVRIAAIRELNMMLGITIIDPYGNTKPRKPLSDFYKDVKLLPAPAANPNQRHPAPGTRHPGSGATACRIERHE
ncbi:hypothetical protein [Paraburkholderia saeva]|uniref:hypothetical protein n=1 Tax=Paraburkholderia saeva TaxID=2777537 RepID=UPI001D6BFEDA|nr:hypothetical protein [Paraburkholderia saeva]CAG4916223.1 hypothetical protein R70241_04427 [Paraburkholderia saeva]